jgi:hypothetical protein
MAIENDTSKPAAETLPEQVNTQRESLFHPLAACGLPRHLLRIYRAHIGSAYGYGKERTAYVEAASHRDATRKIVNAVAALECRLPDAVEERIYNVASARELIEEGLSKDIELRLFETGWCGDEAVSFVEEPLFLLAAPAALIRKWTQISGAEVSHV